MGKKRGRQWISIYQDISKGKEGERWDREEIYMREGDGYKRGGERRGRDERDRHREDQDIVREGHKEGVRERVREDEKDREVGQRRIVYERGMGRWV